MPPALRPGCLRRGVVTGGVAGGEPTPSVQWEVNTGSGFTSLTDGGVYSGSSTDALTNCADCVTGLPLESKTGWP